MVLVVKNPPVNAGDIRDMNLIPDWGRYPGGGHGNPVQYSCLENPKDRVAWKGAVHRVTKNWTQLKQLSTHQHKSKGIISFVLLIFKTRKLGLEEDVCDSVHSS